MCSCETVELVAQIVLIFLVLVPGVNLVTCSVIGFNYFPAIAYAMGPVKEVTKPWLPYYGIGIGFVVGIVITFTVFGLMAAAMERR